MGSEICDSLCQMRDKIFKSSMCICYEEPLFQKITITTQIQYINVQQILVVTFEFTGVARGFMIMSCAARGVKKVGQHWPTVSQFLLYVVISPFGLRLVATWLSLGHERLWLSLEVLLLWAHPTGTSHLGPLETFFQYHMISSALFANEDTDLGWGHL